MPPLEKPQQPVQFGRTRTPRPRKLGPDACLAEKGMSLERIYVTAGVAAYNSGKFHDAIGEFSNALGENRNNPVALMYVGMMHRDMGQHDDAILLLSRSIDLHASPRAYVERAITHVRKNALERAKADAANAIELDADYAPAYLWLGICRGLEGRHAEALQLFSKYLELVPGDAEMRQNLHAYQKMAMEPGDRRPVPTFFVSTFTPVRDADGLQYVIRMLPVATERD